MKLSTVQYSTVIPNGATGLGTSKSIFEFLQVVDLMLSGLYLGAYVARDQADDHRKTPPKDLPGV